MHSWHSLQYSVAQVLKVVEACSNYLRAQLDVENCVDIVTIAETYSLDTLRDKVYRFMSENLAVFAQRPEFHRLSANQVCTVFKYMYTYMLKLEGFDLMK